MADILAPSTDEGHPALTPKVDLPRRLTKCGAASVYEALGRRNAIRSSICPLWTPANIAGPAFTVAGEPGDNLALYRAVAEAPRGAIIVAAMGSSDVAVWGGFLSSICRNKRIVGFVTDGLVRDSDRIRAIAFPVFSSGTSLLGPTKEHPGRLQVAIELGAVPVAPGDWIVGDGDGVVVVPAACVEETTIAAEALEREEEEIIRLVGRGEVNLEQFGAGSVVDISSKSHQDRA